MKIIKEEFKERGWTAALESLIIKEECLVAGIEKYNSIRQRANKISKKTGKKFSFKTYPEVGEVKVWRIK